MLVSTTNPKGSSFKSELIYPKENLIPNNVTLAMSENNYEKTIIKSNKIINCQCNCAKSAPNLYQQTKKFNCDDQELSSIKRNDNPGDEINSDGDLITNDNIFKNKNAHGDCVWCNKSHSIAGSSEERECCCTCCCGTSMPVSINKESLFLTTTAKRNKKNKNNLMK